MSRLIDADALKKDLDAWARVINKPQFYNREETLHIIDKAPTVEPKRGEWVQYYETTMDGETVAYGWECSLCGRWAMECEPFCHCGAYMKGIL